MRRPPNIFYGVDDKPPHGVTVLSGLQHVGLISIILVYPLLVTREAGLSSQASQDVLSLSMIVLGIGAILQVLPRGFIGARLLCPPTFTAAYLAPSLIAVKTGGLSLVLGMTAFGGVIALGLSRVLRPLRPYFPSEISGLVVVMIGIAVGALGLRSVVGGTTSQSISEHLTVAAITLGTMVGLNIWTKGAPRLFCALFGMIVGYLIAAVAGMTTAEDFAAIHSAPFAGVPGIGHLGWSFDLGSVVPFLVAAFATCIRTMGDVTTAQKINDADWVRPDMRSISGGVLANGLSNITAGLLGTVGVSTYTSSVGLAGATGIVSRRVGFAIGGIFIVLAFLPKASAFLVIMPGPVVGAALLFSASVIFVNGLQIVTSRMLDARRTFVIGLSFMFGLAVDLQPQSFAGMPAELLPFVSSSLVLATVSALLLNAIFRLGVRRTRTLDVVPAQFNAVAVEEFIEAQGASWGARRDVIERASFNLVQSIETIIDGCNPTGMLTIEATFDEFSLDVRVSYEGAPLDLPDKRPTNEEIMASEDAQRKLAGFMLRRHADRVAATHKDGRSTILFHFDH